MPRTGRGGRLCVRLRLARRRGVVGVGGRRGRKRDLHGGAATEASAAHPDAATATAAASTTTSTATTSAARRAGTRAPATPRAAATAASATARSATATATGSGSGSEDRPQALSHPEAHSLRPAEAALAHSGRRPRVPQGHP